MTTSPGEATVTRLEGGVTRVDRADPIIWISTEFLEAEHVPSVVIDGDLVSFGDINPVTYRITERHQRHVVAEKMP